MSLGQRRPMSNSGLSESSRILPVKPIRSASVCVQHDLPRTGGEVRFFEERNGLTVTSGGTRNNPPTDSRDGEPRSLPKGTPARRILFLDHTASLGGGEIALLNLVQALDRRLYAPIVLLFSDGPLLGKLREAGVETHLLPLSPRVAEASKDSLGAGVLLRLKDFGETLAFIVRLARFIRTQRADLVHTNSLKSDVLGGLAARLARVPVIWHVRDSITPDYLPGPIVMLFRRLCRIVPRHVIANSHATLATVFPSWEGASSRRNMPRAASVAHDGVPVALLAAEVQAEEEAAVAEFAAPRIGLVGRISPWKGQHVFLRAAALVRQRYPQARFQIIGAALFNEQEYERQISALAASLDLNGSVEFTGFRSDVQSLITGLDILVHASTTGEPFGQVIVEGMAAGKPVVATRGGGVPEIVLDGQTGLLVPMGDVPAMADAILLLLDDPAGARRLGRLGRSRVGEHFTTALTARRVEDIYERLLSRRLG